MEVREIISNLKLIDRVVPDYTSGRNRGLSDEESEKIALEAVTQAIETLEKQII